MYSDVQKGLIIPLIAFPSLLFLFVFYRIGKRPLYGSNMFGDRMELFYSYTAAALLGQFLFQALPNATGPSGPQIGAFVSLFVLVGFYVMLCIQKYQRVSHTNPHYVSPENNSIEINSLLDRESMEIVEYYHAVDLESESAALDRLQLSDENAELRKRRRIFVLTLVILIILCILEGFFLVYKPNTWLTWVFFIVDKYLETCVIGVSMLHSLIHATTEREPRWYLYCSLIWVTIASLSTVPMIADMSYDAVYLMVNHLATSIFYALAGGVLFWIALYYIWIDRKRVDKQETVVRLVIFGITGGISWVVGFFF